MEFVHATYRPGAPKSCDECVRRQRTRPDPDRCFFEEQFKLDHCPFLRLQRRPLLPQLLSFCAIASDDWEEEDKMTKAKKKKYGVSIEKFRLACDVFVIEKEDLKEALDWVQVFCHAANESQDLATIEARKARGWA